jgi:hypothetical protein
MLSFSAVCLTCLTDLPFKKKLFSFTDSFPSPALVVNDDDDDDDDDEDEDDDNVSRDATFTEMALMQDHQQQYV